MKPLIPSRDRTAFDDFVRGSGDRLVRTAFLLCGDRGHAEDIVQTALLRAARRWGAARGHPEAYARRVVVNLAKDHWRNTGRRPAETALDAALDSPSAGPPDRNDDLLAAARTLPPGQRAVLVLRFFDDLPVEETARALGVSTGTVKSPTARALAQLRAVLTMTKETADADR